MAEKTTPTKKLSDKSTKQEMLEAYQALAKQLEEKRQTELNPERKLEEKKTQEALKAAGTVVADGIDREIGGLKSEISIMLAEVSEKLGTEATRFRNVQNAVEAKEAELKELYGIEKAASTLAALIEAQSQKRRDFEAENAQLRESLTGEIEETRTAWQKERQAHEAEVRERDTAEKKARDRDKEQFDYAFKREQQTWRDKLADERAALEKELFLKKENTEKALTTREQAVAEKEAELNALRTEAAAFPKELETAVSQVGREISDKLKLEAKNREELLKKEFEGERNVLSARVESLEKMAKDLAEQNTRLNKQLEGAYQKVQEIAEKTIESAGHAKSFAELQKLLVEQGRKVATEK